MPRPIKIKKGKFKKRKPKPTPERVIFMLVSACMLLGIAAGAVYGLTQWKNIAPDGISAYLRGFAQNGQISLSVKRGMFQESVLKHVKTAVLIWFMAFIPAGGFAASGFVIARGFGYGFATCVLVKGYRASGLICAALLYLPQAILLIPAYLYVAYRCLKYVSSDAGTKEDGTGLINYFSALAAGCALCAAAGAVDAYLVPLLVARFL